ncbi:hypothetical protein O1611_g123 [Lasiodiplodia mahajangana]|uniref:Uncharacterized protein n=1 Tax=Lasiodiplodia mahajangana TaxID=1108764 RepID=A0ACC2K1G9_9PEZI|nr:hypothetical protein O1611_g123 [Lasiodiplodia mahajangana]
MAPKRKPVSLEISSDSDSDVVVRQPPTATTALPEVMRNIEMLKAKREAGRKKISAGFDAYIAGKKNEVEAHYTSKTKKRTSEVKELLTRYAEALEQRAAIEKSIEELVLDARDELQQLMIVLEAAYTGRQGQLKAATGSFASLLEPVMVKTPAPDKDDANMQDEGRADKAGRNYAGDSKYQKENQGREDIFDRISW